MSTIDKCGRLCLMLLGLPALVGCQASTPTRALAMNSQTLEWRQTSTRRFQTSDEALMLSAAAGVLQDLGFTLDGSESDLGLLVASKDRSAVEGGQVAAKIMMAALFRANIPIDKVQKLRASVVTKPAGSEVAVRATFQRIVWNDRGMVSRLERLAEPEMYQMFFERLSKAVFLEAQGI